MLHWKLYGSIFSALFCIALSEDDWSYETADTWYQDFPECGGNEQSPIALTTDGVRSWGPEEREQVQATATLSDRNYIGGVLYNNGRRAKMDGNSSFIQTFYPPRLIFREGGGAAEYKFVGLDFHWPCSHTLEGERCALELHLEFRNHNGHIIVQTYLFNVCLQAPEAMDKMASLIGQIAEPGSSVHVTPFRLRDLIGTQGRGKWPRQLCNFIFYDGSLLMPPCTEDAVYMVMTETLCVTPSQMQEFMQVVDLKGRPMAGYRPLQPWNQRRMMFVPC